MPRVTVAIPTHRRPELLTEAIRSVLNQTYQDFEILVVDDNSRDNTEEVVRALGDGRIRYLSHETNKRCGAARNTAIRSSTSELVAFLDDDDEWLPEKLERQIELLDRSSAATGVVYTGFQAFDRSSRRVVRTYVPATSGNMLEHLGRNNVGPPSTVLLRRSCFEKAGVFDESLEFGEDWDFWIRLARHVEFACVSEPLVRYGVHSARMTTNAAWRIRGFERFAAKHRAFLETHPRELCDFYLGMGRHYMLVGEDNCGRTSFLRAVRLSPFRLKAYQYLALSLLGARIFCAVSERSANGRSLRTLPSIPQAERPERP